MRNLPGVLVLALSLALPTGVARSAGASDEAVLREHLARFSEAVERMDPDVHGCLSGIRLFDEAPESFRTSFDGSARILFLAANTEYLGTHYFVFDYDAHRFAWTWGNEVGVEQSGAGVIDATMRAAIEDARKGAPTVSPPDGRESDHDQCVYLATIDESAAESIVSTANRMSMGEDQGARARFVAMDVLVDLLIPKPGDPQANASACGTFDADFARNVDAQLSRLQDAGIDEAEAIGVELGRSFDVDACVVVKRMIDAGFEDDRIGDYISMLPVEYVDRACESRKKLAERLQTLERLPNDAHIGSIRTRVQSSLLRDERECAASTPKR